MSPQPRKIQLTLHSSFVPAIQVSIVASYIKERTKNAQFIVISLRNNMFELASRLVGVYKVNHMVSFFSRCCCGTRWGVSLVGVYLGFEPGLHESDG